MLPILVARQITEALRQFLTATFPVTTPRFRYEDGSTLLDEFLNTEGALAKGPWLEIKLPFRTAAPDEPLPFARFAMPFQPWQHQMTAFRRLCGVGARSTLVATGTGSGKTECFMYPLLDHCLTHRGQGIKAVIVYPMNALATDQARRFASECAKLDPKLNVGLFTGDDGSNNRYMTPEQVITHRETMRDSPPDILLTNYRMLDFLLMRPIDQRLWRFNTPGTLRYLVVDELHTFDGAQGTDLACLIRRLRDKLKAGDELACVGTSATIGDATAVEELRDYAEQVFATTFDAEAIVLEDRLEVDEYLRQTRAEADVIARWPTDAARELRPVGEAGVYLRRAAEIWLGENLALDAADEPTRLAAAVRLGELLPRLTAFQELLRRAHRLCEAQPLALEWQQRLRLADTAVAESLIDSLVALISAARLWRDPARRPAQPTPDHIAPFLQVRVQLWLRELRRMVASVAALPRLTHADDLLNLGDPLHLPLLHCRECHAMAWGAIKPEGDSHLKPDLQAFYQTWFAKTPQNPDAVLLFPLEAERRPPEPERRWLCATCQHLTPWRGAATCPDCREERLAVWMPDLRRTVERGGRMVTVISDDCPCCGGHAALTVVGSRAASLSSVLIGELFGSDYNDDHKLIAFSDSVQDAAHRAGFFGARTYSQTLRNALARFIRERGEGLPLPRLAQEFPSYWRGRLDDESFVGTFIAPNMQWLQGYRELKDHDRIPAGSDVVDLVARRLSWEVLTEFGLRSRIGRTLERTAVATVIPDEISLQQCAERLAARLREELGTLRDIRAEEARHFLLGLLARARQQGAFYSDALESYVREGGNTFLLNRLHFMPGYGLGNRPPAMLSLNRISANFETLFGQGRWYLDWFNKSLAMDQPLATAEYEQAYRLAFETLEKSGWLIRLDVRGEPVWGLDPLRWQATTQVLDVACRSCGHRLPVAARQLDWMIGLRCLRLGCAGEYRAARSLSGAAHYRAWPRRLVPSEHTGLMDGSTRHRVEHGFIHGRDAWSVNLLSATPTLEMGINIGDLSSVLLCSVPPAQANYLQRIGRAGRRDGNALAVTIAAGQRHDLYFYAVPEEMMAGQVSPPGVFLQAMAVLERQLIAFCFDRWVATGIDASAIPKALQTILDTVESGRTEGFPHNLLDYTEIHAATLLKGFLDLFPDLDPDGARHLREFLFGGKAEGGLAWRILNRLNELAQTRKSLKSRVDGLKKRIAQLESQPADEARDQYLADCRDERNALLALTKSINGRQTLNFFTDEGLLPNYAFPEEGVTLNSVILRRREIRDEGGEARRYEAVNLSFQRSAQAALGELVPEARFYAAEHHLNIEQVDLKVTKPQTWRLCPSCHYSENLETSSDPHGSCPRCGNPLWADAGQKRTLLKLRQVYARADSRYDRIGDDSDQREPAFYRRQLLVDVPPEAMRGGYRLASEELPFGFEYLHNAGFREINFGEPGDAAETFHVAGRNEARRGFQLCRHCGMVRRQRPRRGQRAHALDCALSKPGTVAQETDWINSLYLYRELNSEAIRILLPLAEVAQSETIRASFMAALNLGLRRYFRGNVQHLEITEMLEAGIDGHSPRQYLVIYDRVPGGTGYLKELMRTPANLMGLLWQARDHLAECACADESDHDGCYRCILAYRDSRHQVAVSRRAALDLLERVLRLESTLEAIDRLSEVEVNSVLGSALEARFIATLARGVDVGKKVVNGKPGYWLRPHLAQDVPRVWELEPQVKLGPDQGVRVPTVPDFVLRPVREAERALFGQWALYLDGFGPHWGIQTDDTRKRLAVMRSGRRVWSLGWQDLPQTGTTPDSVVTDYLMKHRQPAQLNGYDQLADRSGWHGTAALNEMLMAGPFRILMDFLHKPAETLEKLEQAPLCNAIGWLALKAPQAWNDPGLGFETLLPRTIWQALNQEATPLAYGGLIEGLGTGLPPVSVMMICPKAVLASKERLLGETGMFLCLDDTMATQTKAFETTWRGFWHATNVLQFAPRFAIATRSGVAQQVYEATLEGWPDPIGAKTAETTAAPGGDWAEIYDLCQIERAQLERLAAAGVPLPEVGLDLCSGEATVATAELAWPDHRLAVMLEATGDIPEVPDWTLISVDRPEWIEWLLERFSKGE